MGMEIKREMEMRIFSPANCFYSPPYGPRSPTVEVSKLDKTVIKIAKYALDKYNHKKGSCLQLKRVKKAKYRMVNNRRLYSIILLASGGEDYEADVLHYTEGEKEFMLFHSLTSDWISSDSD